MVKTKPCEKDYIQTVHSLLIFSYRWKSEKSHAARDLELSARKGVEGGGEGEKTKAMISLLYSLVE